MKDSMTGIYAVLVLSAISMSSALRATNKLPCRSKRPRALEQSGRTFDYLLDYLSGDSGSIGDSSNELPCLDNIISGESQGYGEEEQSSSSEEYASDGVTGGDYPTSPPHRPTGPRPGRPHHQGDHHLLNVFGFNQGHHHRPPPPVHRPLPPVSKKRSDWWEDDDEAGGEGVQKGHYPVKPPLLLPGHPTAPSPGPPARPSRPPRPPRPPGGDGLSDIFGSVFGHPNRPFSSTIEEIKPVYELTGEQDTFMTWRPVGPVGGFQNEIVGVEQDFSKWTTAMPHGGARRFLRDHRAPKKSSGILGSFLDLLLRR